MVLLKADPCRPLNAKRLIRLMCITVSWRMLLLRYTCTFDSNRFYRLLSFMISTDFSPPKMDSWIRFPTIIEASVYILTMMVPHILFCIAAIHINIPRFSLMKHFIKTSTLKPYSSAIENKSRHISEVSVICEECPKSFGVTKVGVWHMYDTDSFIIETSMWYVF